MLDNKAPKKPPFKIKETTTREYTGGEMNDANALDVIKRAYGDNPTTMQQGGVVPMQKSMQAGAIGGALKKPFATPAVAARKAQRIGTPPSKIARPNLAYNAPAFQQGGQMLQEGGMAEGPSHEEGGIPVEQEDTGEQVAEIEGGERVFSIEDTQMMEEAAMQIQEAMQAGDQQAAEDLAMRLGMAVVQMIAAQEQNQASQEQGMAEGQPPAAPSEEVAAAANQFGQEPEMMETM